MAAAKVIILASVSAIAAWAQARPEFEVASVKLAPATPPIALPACAGTRYSSISALGALLLFAYDIRSYQLIGLPQWREWVSIDARSAAPMSEQQCRQMLRALLADRLKLAMHHDSKSMEVYALVVSKNGAKVKPVADSDSADGVHINGAKTYGTPKGWSMAQLADFFQRSFPQGPPIVDHTGLSGLYKMTLDFAPGPYGVPGVEPRGDGPDIFGAVDSQLGLRLERRTEPVETTVLDHVEKPDTN